MNYCRIHGDYEGDGCSYCREVVEREAVDRRVMIERLDDIEGSQRKFQEAQIEAIKNPGDYYCGHCRFRTLKYGAKKCPKCLGEVDSNSWKLVDEAEKITREHEQYKKIEKEKRLAIERETKRINDEKKSILLTNAKQRFWRLYTTGFLLSILAAYFLFRYYHATIISFFIVYSFAGIIYNEDESYNKPIRSFFYLLMFAFFILIFVTPVVWFVLYITGGDLTPKDWTQ